jgi:2-keto-4-pentenoate hydratase/2-oxohepta-3-ene-1,7-dioic acid hydratase in catechol pathway
MKICSVQGKVGIVEENYIKFISGFNSVDEYIQNPGQLSHSGELIKLEETKLDAPIQNPSKILGIGLNYFKHAAEVNKQVPSEPLVFLKPPSTIIGANQAVQIPRMSTHVEFETELAVVIGERTKNVDEEEAYSKVFGYSIILDMSARDFQKVDGTLFRAKGFDTFAPIGPYIVTTDEIPDPHSLDIKLWQNGELKQSDNTREMIFKIPQLISFISRVTTLYPGDVIATGTPAGVGPVKSGDKLVAKIDRIGTLEVSIER